MGRTVVCGYDASPASGRALEWAAHEASLRHEALHVVMALNWPDSVEATDPVSLLSAEHHNEEIATQALETAVQALSARHRSSVTSAVEFGAATPVLLNQSRHASLLVLGARGIGGFERMLLGSVSTAVAEHAHCPVVVVRPPAPRSEAARFAGRIVVGIDGSAASERAVGFAFEEASRRQVGLVAVHALHTDPIVEALAIMSAQSEHADALSAGASRLMEDVLSPWRSSHPGVEVTTFHMFGHPVTVLGYAAAGSPLLVVGTRGQGALKAAVGGSVSRGVLHHASGPVAVVPFPA